MWPQYSPIVPMAATEKLGWDKISDTQINSTYTSMMNERLSDLKSWLALRIRKLEDSIIESIISFIAKTMIEVSAINIPKSKFRKYLKPYWNSQLNTLSKHKLNVWRQWKAAGKPRETGDPLWRAYKKSKSEFRCAQRAAETRCERQAIDELCHAVSLDQKHFWKLINKNKGQKHKLCAIREHRVI